MFRLGIIGSDNSHAEAFSKLANLENGYNGLKIDDVQVTHIYGTDTARTKEVADAGKIPNIVANAEEMIGQVDGVICVWRHGGKHIEALPFLRAGIPAFIDKPLACSVADATALLDAAVKAGVGFTSFSTLRYAANAVDYINDLRANAGDLLAGTCSGPADLDSEYGGIFFYGIHTVEMMNAVFGYGCREVHAVAQDGSVAAICTFANGAIVTLNMMKDLAYAFHVLAFGKKAWKQHTIDASSCYYDGMQVFLDTMKTGKWPLDRDQLLEPVKILAAIDESLKQGRTVKI
jgi:predicted dehydrogenase